MLTHTKLIQTLTSENWDRRTRNTAARSLALGRNDGGDDVIRHTYLISQREPIGRYDRLRAQLLRVVAESHGCAAHIRSQSYKYQGQRLRYNVVLFGFRSDIDHAIAVYEELERIAVEQCAAITGDRLSSRRRQCFTMFLAKITDRLADVTHAPGMKWVGEHYSVAHSALEHSPARWHREMA